MEQQKVVQQEVNHTQQKATGKKNPGRGATQRRQDRFREKVGQIKLKAVHDAVLRRLGVIKDPETEPVVDALSRINPTVKTTSIPLVIGTRGVGLSVSRVYAEIISNWDAATVAAICTVYQFFRVALIAVSYKYNLVSTAQREAATVAVPDVYLLDGPVRQLMKRVVRYPLSIANLLSTIGLVQSEDQEYHPVLMQKALQEDSVFDVSHLHMHNIRDYLVLLANVETDVEWRNVQHDYNSIPGAIFDGADDDNPVLLNPDDVWPEGYSHVELQDDIAAFNNLVAMAETRVPPGSFIRVDMVPEGFQSLVVCSDISPISIHGRRRALVPDDQVRLRDAGGGLVEHQAHEVNVYTGDVIIGRGTEEKYWSLSSLTSPDEFKLGASTFLGEFGFLASRDREVGRLSCDLVPMQVLDILTSPMRDLGGS